MITDKKPVTLGAMGEKIIADIIHGAKKTDDWFDSTKDGIITEVVDGKKVEKIYEVKTMRLNHKHQGLFIDKTQFKKLDGVDYNFWVRIPEKLEDGIKIYEYYANEFSDLKMNGTSGRLYDINQMDYVQTIDKPGLTKQMLDLSKSLSKHKRFKK